MRIDEADLSLLRGADYLGMVLMALLIAVRLIAVGIRHDDTISSREVGH